MIKRFFVFFLILIVFSIFIGVSYADEASKAKPNATIPQIQDMELTGILSSSVMSVKDKEGKDTNVNVYLLKTDKNIVVALPDLINGEAANLSQYISKKIVVKVKAFSMVRKNAKGENYDAIRVKELLSVTLVEEKSTEPQKEESAAPKATEEKTTEQK